MKDRVSPRRAAPAHVARKLHRANGRHRRTVAFLLLPLFALGLNGAAPAQQPAPTEPTASAVSPPYFDPKTLDLGRLLPPAPANDSEITRNELQEILKIQNTRTPAKAERAAADAQVSVYRFADALGNPIAFNATSLPKFDLLFRKVLREEGAVVQPAKRSFARPRPFLLEPRIAPPFEKPPNESYPSGHALWGHTVGLLLSDMLPEYRVKLMARADEYSFNRVVAGVHYPSDIESGKLAATALTAFLFASPEFLADYVEAKKELRAALKLPALN